MQAPHRDFSLRNYTDIEALKKNVSNPKCQDCNKDPKIGEKWHKYRTHLKIGEFNHVDNLLYCIDCWDKKYL